MRFIDLERLEDIPDWPPGNHRYRHYAPEKWQARLEKAQEELRNAPDKEARSKIFTRYSDLWSDAKVHLRNLLHDKCWYCETKTSGFPGDIDHYRPKGGIAEAPDLPGYWWLAFEWRNWRFVCRFCNSENKDQVTGRVDGKGDSFPLLNGETCRIKGPDKYTYYDQLLREDPKLLDPTDQRDVRLLTFTSEGLPEPAAKKEQVDDYERARASIEIYHLDSSRLKNKRKEIFAKVKREIEDYQRYMHEWDTEHNYTSYAMATKAGKMLGRMIAMDGEYSMTAITYLEDYLQRHPDWTWIQKLLVTPSEPAYKNVYAPIADPEPATSIDTAEE